MSTAALNKHITIRCSVSCIRAAVRWTINKVKNTTKNKQDEHMIQSVILENEQSSEYSAALEIKRLIRRLRKHTVQ